MRNLLMSLLAAVVGGLGTAATVVAIMLAAYNGVPDRDGGRSMGIIFMIGPFSAVVGGVITAVITYRLLARSQTAEAAATHSRPIYKTLLMWVFGVLSTLSLAVAGVNLMTAGGLSDARSAVGFALAFGLGWWWAGRRTPSH